MSAVSFTAAGSLDMDRPDPALIELGDIATGLSRIFRWHGAIPITVAQHSVSMAQCASTDESARWCLLHDAAETWIGDLPSIVKHRPGLAPFRKIEERILAAVAERFGLDLPMPAEVKRLDRRALKREVDEWLPHAKRTAGRVEPLPLSFVPAWTPAQARERFLTQARSLGLH